MSAQPKADDDEPTRIKDSERVDVEFRRGVVKAVIRSDSMDNVKINPAVSRGRPGLVLVKGFAGSHLFRVIRENGYQVVGTTAHETESAFDMTIHVKEA